MHKCWLSLALLAGFALAACGRAATAVVTPIPATLPPIQPTAFQARLAQCTAESTLPKADPIDAERFGPVSDQDWVKGSPEAKVTLLEYSDFM